MARCSVSNAILSAILAAAAACLPAPSPVPSEQEQAFRNVYCELNFEAMVVQTVAEQECRAPDGDPLPNYSGHQYTFEVIANDPRGRSGRFPNVGERFDAIWPDSLDVIEPNSPRNEGCFHIDVDTPRCTGAMRRAPHLNTFDLFASLPAEPNNSCAALGAQPIYQSHPLLLPDFTPDEVHAVLVSDESCIIDQFDIPEL